MWNHGICREVDGPGNCYVNQNKPDLERQIKRILYGRWSWNKEDEKGRRYIKKGERITTKRRELWKWKNGEEEDERWSGIEEFWGIGMNKNKYYHTIMKPITLYANI